VEQARIEIKKRIKRIKLQVQAKQIISSSVRKIQNESSSKVKSEQKNSIKEFFQSKNRLEQT
jgi:hypothetical protein